MDFGTLLHTAKKNEGVQKGVRYYSTKFEPPKKTQRNKTLSVNVQKFLARKEAEEKEKLEEARRKKEELLALRAQDKKSTRRVNVMLKRTKSANQSVLAEAADNNHTAITMTGNSQPDEDDYGYVSQEASEFYNKMMEKYNKMPDEPKFPTQRKKISTNLASTKERMTAALEREKEELNTPHKRRKKHEISEEKDFEEPKPVVETKSKPKMPPPMNFNELLRVAEKKQYEPIVIEKKEVVEERPLTKKQKKELERHKEYMDRKLNGTSQVPSVNKIPKLSSSTDKNSTTKKPAEIVQKASSTNNVIKPVHKDESKSKISSSKKISAEPKKLNDVKSPRKDEVHRNLKPPDRQSIPKPLDKNKSEEKIRKYTSSEINKTNGHKLVKRSETDKVAALEKRPYLFDNSKQKTTPKCESAVQKPLTLNNVKSNKYSSADVRINRPNESKLKEFPPKDIKPRQFPPPDVRRREDAKKKMLLQKRRIMDDDDEDEYDPEMDDFIDDGPQDDYSNNYSKYISEIFGYDKSRYRHADDDIDNMESSFAQQMREEVISTKIGIMEDLEDMKMEEEAKRKKLLMKKKGKI